MNTKRTPPHAANLLDTASPSSNHTHTTFHTHLYTHTPSHLPSHLTSHLTLYLTSQLILHLTPPVITSHSYIRLFSMHHPCTVSRAPDPGIFPGPGSRPGTDVECPRPGNAPFRAPDRNGSLCVLGLRPGRPGGLQCGSSFEPGGGRVASKCLSLHSVPPRASLLTGHTPAVRECPQVVWLR